MSEDLALEARSAGWMERPRAAVFLATVIFGGALFWVAPRPPMGDLPQHAAQITMLHDLFTGTSRWSDMVRVNYLTPYLLGLSIATALSFAMPVIAALKVVLAAGYFAFVAAGVALRKEFEADERLDWLIIPGYFGLSFQYGFFTFLVATPVGLLFLRLARRFARAPTRASALRLVAAGVVLFFAHGLVFIFCVVAAFGMTAVEMKRSTVVRALVPYVVLGLVAVASFVNTHLNEPVLAHGDAPIDWEWDKPGGWHRIAAFADYVVASTLHDFVFLPIVALMMAAPWILGDRPTRDRAAWMPFAVVVVLWVFMPGQIPGWTTYLYQRFAIFLLPAYALLFRASPAPRSRAVAVEAGLALLCWVFFGSLTVRERRFVREAGDFETVLDAAEPGQRALNIVLDPYSPAIRHPWAYHAYALWYQVDRGGFVDFNFAALLPEVARFRPGRAPPLTTDVETFDWRGLHASIYRYFFVRHSTPLPRGLFDNDQCRVELVREAGEWSLFERRECLY